MTLNASGPISLGGSTVGQSINLELNQAATATTSLNATNVRTLLQVASGQISLSNAYGKSNFQSFALYLGIIANGGRNGPISDQSFYVAANSGVMGIKLAWNPPSTNINGGMFAYVDDSGTQVTTANYTSGNSGDSVIMPPGNSLSTSNIYPLALSVYANSVNASTSYTSTAWGTTFRGVNGSPYYRWSAVGSDNSIAFMGLVDLGKSGYYTRISKWDSSGNFVASKYIGGTNIVPTTDTHQLLIRSDGTYLAFWTNGFGGQPSYVNWGLVSSAIADSYTQYRYNTAGFSGAALNPSDNSYILVFESRYVIVGASANYYIYSNFRLGKGNKFWGITYYNGFYYTGTTLSNTGSDTNILSIIAINASTGAIAWSQKFSFGTNAGGTGQVLSAFQNFYNGTSIYANAKGLFFAVGLVSNNGEAFVIKMPLTGGLATAVYTGVGSNLNMSVSAGNSAIASSAATSITNEGTLSLNNSGSASGVTRSSTTGPTVTFSPKTTLS